jgi:signal transduction histidine kinase
MTPRVQGLTLAAGILSGAGAAAAFILGGYPTPYPTLVLAVLATLVVGWSFLFTGLAATRTRPDSRVGLLMIVAGFAAFVRAVAAIDTPVTYAIARAVEDVVYGVVAHLLVSFPTGRLLTRGRRAVVALVYALTLPLDLVIYLVAAAPSGCGDCRSDIAIPRYGVPRRDLLDVAVQTTVLVVAGLLLWLMYRRWRDATPALQRTLGPALLGGALFVATIAAQRVGILLDAPFPVRVVLAWSQYLALAFFPVGLLAGLVRTRLDRSAVADLAVALTTSPGHAGLQEALAAAVHDPTLQVVYWAPEQGTFVDDHGHAVTPDDHGGLETTVLERDGEPVAALLHDAVLSEHRSLLQAVAATAGLAIENERLQAALRAQLVEVRASRTRLVAATVAERRRLERNLHDGAQQSLLGVLLALRLAHTQLAPLGVDPAVDAARGTLDQARGELGIAIDEIRELAQGIHPGVLSQAGLAAALRGLAERSSVPVLITAVPPSRLPSLVEETAYFVVAESLTNVVKHARASHAVVCVQLAGPSLTVDVTDDGDGGADPAAGTGLRGLADRVAATDGTLRVENPEHGGTRVHAEIRCA